jgi:PAS domain S-box-containing protein
MIPGALKTDILFALDIAAFEQAEDGSFTLINTPPEWFLTLCPPLSQPSGSINLTAAFAFLEYFLQDAEGFWKDKDSGRLKSGPWVETDPSGNLHHLEASAFCAGEKKVLLIEPLRLEYDQIQELAQKARDKSLAYERLFEVEQALRESEKRYRDVVENSLGLICTHDLDGRLLMVNPAVARSLGYQPEEIIGRNLQDFLAPSVKRFFDQYLHQIKTHQTATGLIVLLRRDGQERIWQYHNFRQDETATPYVLGHAQDVTETKQLESDLIAAREAAIHASQAKSAFLANMSHEIRTPMNGILGMIDLLLKTSINADQRKMAETVQSSANTLLMLINDILDFSKIESGKMILEAIDFDLRSVVESVVDLLAEEAQKKHLELATFIHKEVPETLRGDPVRLRQILLNLVGNAIKFTNQGEVVVSVNKEAFGNRQIPIHFVVTDTGIGISKEVQGSLFQAFSQADTSTTRRYGGTGLGLAISRQLVELMQGEIGVESQEGKGSSFFFTVMFEAPSNAAQNLLPRVPSLELANVLIVDDNATNRTILGHYIDSWGLRYHSTESASQALIMLRQAAQAGEPFDLAVVDMQMPEMDGLTLAQKIKAEPLIASTRLIVLSSLGRRESEKRRKKAGVDAYLNKPVKQSELFDCIAEVTSRRRDPLQASEKKATAKVSEAKPFPTDRLKKAVRLLVAEDNPVNREVACMQLQSLGYSADTVTNGREALEALQKSDYDIVLMDCQMPEMDGYEATSELRRLEGNRKHTIVIALTANALQGDEAKCLSAGMDDYLSKPIKPEALEAVLEKWTAHHQASAKAVRDTQEESNPLSGAIDARVIAKLRKALGKKSPDLIPGLIDLFIADAAPRLAALQKAISENDGKALRQVAHALKGSCANLGANRMAGLCEILEDKGQTTSLAGAGAILEHLEAEFTLVTQALEDEKSK